MVKIIYLLYLLKRDQELKALKLKNLSLINKKSILYLIVYSILTKEYFLREIGY